MRLSSNLAGHTPHSSSYLPTFVTTGQKRYQKVTRGYCNQVIDLLSAYFLKSVECSPSDTASTHRHILWLVFNDLLQRILHLTIQSLITLHLNALDLSSLVRILRLFRPRNAEDAIQTDGLAKIHRPMTWLILVFRQISSAVF